MTSKIMVKSGGVWVGPVEDGTVNIKLGGRQPDGSFSLEHWVYPTNIWVKSNGAWVDTGYRGYPNEPGTVSVNAWDSTNFLTVSIKWGAASSVGAAPTASYEIQQLSSTGGLINSDTQTDLTSKNFATVEDGKYQFRVRSKSTGGLYSDWSPILKVEMGHKEEGYYANENRTRTWYKEINGNWYKDAYIGNQTVINVPDTVVIKEFHYALSANAGFTSALSPFGSRTVTHVFLNVEWGDTMSMNSPYNTIEYGFNNNGDNKWWGLKCKGSGWSTTATGLERMVGKFGIEGVETYQVSVYHLTQAYKANAQGASAW